MADLDIDKLNKFLEDSIDNFNTSKKETKEEVDNVLKDLSEGKIDSLKDATQDIEDLIIQRKQLSIGFSNKVRKIQVDIRNFISEIQQRVGGTTDSGVLRQFVSDIVALKGKGVEIDALDLREQVDCFRDIAQLKKDLREISQEMKEKEARSDILDDILGE